MAQTTCSDVIAFIMSDRCYPGDRARIIEALNESRREKIADASDNFRRGQKVHFHNTRTGQVVTGVVQKVNRMTVNLKDNFGGLWRVSPTLLEHLPTQAMPPVGQPGGTGDLVYDLAAFDPSKI